MIGVFPLFDRVLHLFFEFLNQIRKERVFVVDEVISHITKCISDFLIGLLGNLGR